MKNKHILFIVENQPVPFDNRVWSEAMTMKECGYRVSIISPKGKGNIKSFEKIDDINIYRHPVLFEANGKIGFIVEYCNAIFWQMLLSILIFVKEPFQIIHSANPPDTIFLIALMYKILGTKYIFDQHDIMPENYLAKFNRKDIFYKMICLMEKISFMMAYIVISTNESYKKIATDRGNKREEEVFVVRNGPDLSKVMFVPPNNDLKKGYEHLVVYVGTIGNQECIDVLLRAVKYIVDTKRLFDIKFIIIGTGPHLEYMVNLSKKMQIEKYVNFTGFIPYKEFYEILATADICVNPEYRNSFTDKSTMVKIMDYMVMGKPIVQFETKEGKVTAEESSIYVTENDDIAFAEAIIDLLHNPKQRQRMGTIGQKRIYQLLNWDKQKENLEKAYQYLEKYF
jgi:glycosyltransferase involved in cell wall biosynthesis